MLVAEFSEGFLSVNRFYAAALDVIVPAVQHLARFGSLLKISGHYLLDEVFGRTADFGGEFLNLGLGSWTKVYFHNRYCRERLRRCQSKSALASWRKATPKT